jgi:glycosyltransferase involved in cell wall biosynthesis
VRVLYISYTGLTEPLGRSQIIPYVVGLSDHGHSFSIVSFEKPAAPTHSAPDEIHGLLPPGTTWIPLRYHQRPSVPATTWDALQGILSSLRLQPCNLVHARSTVPALMARVVAARWRVPWLFDVRGFLAQEYVDAGHWSAAGALARLTAGLEQSLLDAASGLVFLTQRAANAHEADRTSDHRPVAVIPCAVDLRRFRFDAVARARLRAEWGLERQAVMVYSGSLGSWYLPGEMLDFLAVARSKLNDLRFLVLTPQPDLVHTEAQKRDLRHLLIVRSITSAEVPAYLSAADFGVAFISPTPSKAASSPTKLAEYLACGLPVVMNAGIGDLDIRRREATWVMIDGFNAEEYARATERIVALLQGPGVRRAARQTAEHAFSLTEAVRKYDSTYRSLDSRGRP